MLINLLRFTYLFFCFRLIQKKRGLKLTFIEVLPKPTEQVKQRPRLGVAFRLISRSVWKFGRFR